MPGPDRGAILVVDDDAAVGRVLVALLEQQRFTAHFVTSGEAALAALESRPFDVVVSDLQMPGVDGMQLLDAIGVRFPGLPVILLTAHGSVPLAVEAMKRGAIDFMLKPFDREEMTVVVDRAVARSKLATEPSPPVALAGSDLISGSSSMNDVMATIRKVAPTTATVLVRGETGTGKELVARALHMQSPRSNQPFIRVHAAALPDSLLESELFGHEKGAFTGASIRKPGRIELAHKGTLFLDEIGDITSALQVKLLRVLQERELERVGGTQSIKVDVRFIAATHRDLEAMVQRGEFREDLFYRLNVVSLHVPPLRERGADVETIARHFCSLFGKQNDRPHMVLDAGALERLRKHTWPGNVRELQNLMERLVVLADGATIREADVERELAKSLPRPEHAQPTADATMDVQRGEAERAALVQALGRAKNNRTLAARLLNISRRTLYNKLREHGIE
ncbi:MAG: sigma-54 dependent transcriptional regulator [Polyangiaceae bacterium]